MTSKQRIAILADWWPRACEVQGWRRDDREQRLEVVSQAVGRPITSFNDLDNGADIDKVKAHLGALAENVRATIELTPAGRDYGIRRRYLYLIRQHSRELAMGDRQSAMTYALKLAHDKFHQTAGINILEDLTTHQLLQLVMTLNARLSSKTRAAKNASLTSEETFPDQVEFSESPRSRASQRPVLNKSHASHHSR